MELESSSSESLDRSLTDDILIEIFTYLPLNSIYKLKCLSKVWLSNLSDPNFITKWFRINNKSLPWIHYHSIKTSNENSLKFKKSYPESHSDFMSRNEHLFSFEFLRNEKPFQGAKLHLCGSSNGLVLCQSVDSDGQRRYHVCNPLTRKWVSIPSPPDSEVSHRDVNAIYCEYSPSSFSSCYKVVRIPQHYVPSKEFKVDVFCSDLGVWESFQVVCDKYVMWGYNQFNAVIRNSVLYWIEGRDRMLVYNLSQKDGSGAHRCSLIHLQDEQMFGSNSFSRRIGESEGLVCYAATGFAGEMTLSVWVLDEVNWQVLCKDISLRDILAEVRSRTNNGYATILVLGFSPVDRNVVLLGLGRFVWGFNIQTRSFVELCSDDKGVHHGRKMFTQFVLNPMPIVLPPSSWIDT